MSTAIGTPVIDLYDNRGFVAEVKDNDNAGRFMIGAGGMQPVASELTIVFDNNRIDTIPDGIAAPWIDKARQYGLQPVDVEVIGERMQAARQAQAAEYKRRESEQDAMAKRRAAFVEEARKRTPAWAKAVLIAELVEDKSDMMTDYHGSTTTRTVILGFSKHTRDLFPEMRKAAATFPETAHLADAPESAENREKYSMGGGYYLKDGYRHSGGWQVSKQTLYNGAESVPMGEWLEMDETPASAPQAASVGHFRIEEHTHTKKGFQMYICVMPERVDRDTFDALRERAQGLYGWYSRPWGKTPGGFAFKRREDAETFAADSMDDCGAGQVDDTESAPALVPGLAEKLRGIADKMQSEIDGKFAGRLTNTPKRQHQAAQARNDGIHLERTQAALRALADAHDAGTIPAVLGGLKTKKYVHELMSAKTEWGGGYYEARRDTGERAVDTPEARALWDLVGNHGEDRRKSEDLRQKVEALQFAKIPGYFPTPAAVIAQMLERAEPRNDSGLRVLEPEAGNGAILDAIREEFPAVTLGAYETHMSLREVLTLKGYELTGADFMESSPSDGRWDRIIMNPPFERGQDIDHVRHAFEVIAPGGRIVSIMSPGPFFRQDRKSQEFRDWFAVLGGEKIDLPAGSFKESGTGVASVMVIIDCDD